MNFCPFCGKKLECILETGIFICKHWFKGKMSEHNMTLLFITNTNNTSVHVLKDLL